MNLDLQKKGKYFSSLLERINRTGHQRRERRAQMTGFIISRELIAVSYLSSWAGSHSACRTLGVSPLSHGSLSLALNSLPPPAARVWETAWIYNVHPSFSTILLSLCHFSISRGILLRFVPFSRAVLAMTHHGTSPRAQSSMSRCNSCCELECAIQ